MSVRYEVREISRARQDFTTASRASPVRRSRGDKSRARVLSPHVLQPSILIIKATFRSHPFQRSKVLVKPGDSITIRTIFNGSIFLKLRFRTKCYNYIHAFHSIFLLEKKYINQLMVPGIRQRLDRITHHILADGKPHVALTT